MENFKLIDEISGRADYCLMVGVNDNTKKYEVRTAYDDVATLFGSFNSYYEAVAFARKDVGYYG